MASASEPCAEERRVVVTCEECGTETLYRLVDSAACVGRTVHFHCPSCGDAVRWKVPRPPARFNPAGFRAIGSAWLGSLRGSPGLRVSVPANRFDESLPLEPPPLESVVEVDADAPDVQQMRPVAIWFDRRGRCRRALPASNQPR